MHQVCQYNCLIFASFSEPILFFCCFFLFFFFGTTKWKTIAIYRFERVLAKIYSIFQCFVWRGFLQLYMFILLFMRWDIFLITKTCLHNFDPLKPHFYIHVVKLGFTGVYIIFLFLLKNIDCGYSLEPPRRGGSNEYPHSMFWAEIGKISEFFIWLFSFFFFFFWVKFSVHLNRHVFVMSLLVGSVSVFWLLWKSNTA